MNAYETQRQDFSAFNQQLKNNILLDHCNLMHTLKSVFKDEPEFIKQVQDFSVMVSHELETVVSENNLEANLPKVEHYNAIGERCDRVIHHPTYVAAGNIIYGSGLMKHLLQPGEMLKTLSLFLMSSHVGEAGHNCPIACSAGAMRVLANYSSLEDTSVYMEKLAEPSFTDNYTAAQFLTEIQGGSDVGTNACRAEFKDNQWLISGEKWFCSNANAEVILMTARFDENISGTKGLGLFLVPAKLENGNPNHYKIRRLKQKIGTRTMATGEIDFEAAIAYPMGEVADGIHIVMENVLHLSRIFNAFSVMGMARRAQQIAFYYAQHRATFGHKIIDYPLVLEALAWVKAENTALIASIFRMVKLQDAFDLNAQRNSETHLLLRTLANLNKYFTAKRSVENIHHCLDILAGNGTIESFSTLPRLLRDCIVCENWEGTHFVLWMQTLKDIHKFSVDLIFIDYMNQLLKEVSIPQYQNILREHLNLLAQQATKLKNLPAEEQSLHIKSLIEKMAEINAATALVLEVQQGAPESKKASLDLFILRYFQKEELPFAEYKKLLKKI